MKMNLSWIEKLGLTILMMVALWGALVPALAQGTPLPNNGRFYQIRRPNNTNVSQVFVLDRYNLNSGGSAIGTATAEGTVLNALGLNPVDRFLYAMRISTGGATGPTNAKTEIFRLGQGAPLSLGNVPGLPSVGDSGFNAATFDGAGNYYVASLRPGTTGQPLAIYRISGLAGATSASSLTFTTIPLSVAPDNGLNDIAWNPANGLIYGTSGANSRTLTVINPTNGTTTETSLTGDPASQTGTTFGTNFFDIVGNLYTYANTGAFNVVDPATANISFLSTAAASSSTDGASDPFYRVPLDVGKSLVSGVANDNRTFDFTFDVSGTNLSTIENAPNFQLTENLARTFAVNSPTVTVVAAPTRLSGATLPLNPAFNGTSDTRLLVGNAPLAPRAGIALRFTVRVQYASAAQVPASSSNVVYASSTSTTNPTGVNAGFTFPDDRPVPPPDVVGFDESPPVQTALTRATGRVYEDVNFGGGAGRAFNATAGMKGATGARVEFYDASGAFVGFTTTAADGTWSYNFAGSAQGAFARVVNGSVLSTRPGATATLIGVQTFRTGDGAAVTGEVGGRAPQSVDAGAGSSGTTLNTTTFVLAGTTTGQAQSVARLGNPASGVDFGFNFDTIVNTNDGGQGSLRQFILNSNALGNAGLDQAANALFDPAAGVETSIFQIPVSRRIGGQMTIDLVTVLPAISDSNTALSGLTQTAFSGDVAPVDASNNITASTGPEVVINAGTITVTAKGPGLLVLGQNTIVEGLGVTGVGATTPAGTNAGSPNGAGILVRGNGADGGGARPPVAGNPTGSIIRNNTVYNNRSAGIRLEYGATVITVQNNVTRGVVDDIGDGIELEFGITNSSFTGNRSIYNAGYGVDIHSAPNNTGNTFTGNVFRGNGQGPTAVSNAPKQGAGIGIRLGSNNTITGNLIYENQGDGIIVRRDSTGNRISRNSIYANAGLAIDLITGTANNNNGDDVSPNDSQKNNAQGNGGMDYPIFTRVEPVGSGLRVSGYIGNATAGSALFGGAQIEFYLADNAPANQNGAVIVGDGRSVPHGEGRTFLQSATADSNGLFDFTISNLTLNANTLTATATDASGNTSEFSANSGILVPVAGVTVSGTVYLDANRNGTLDNQESGTGVSGLFVKAVLQGQTNATQAVAVDAATGAFNFAGLAAGNYTLVLDDNATLTDIAPAIPAGFVGTQAPDGTRGVTVTNQPVSGQNFGLFQGAQISGTVYEDNGAGGGIANDGVRGGGEPGLAGVRLNLTRQDGSVVDSVTTDASGGFAFRVPNDQASGQLRVVEVNLADYVSTGAQVGNTAGTYDRATDAITFNYAAGATYSGLSFGDVRGATLSGEDAKTGTIGSSVSYTHVFTAQTAGSVTFNVSQLPSPANPNWSVVAFRDSNGNGELDGADAQLGTAPIAVVAGQEITVFLQNFVPTTAANGAQDKLTITATFTASGANAPPVQVLTRSDLTTVAPNQGLLLTKVVDKATARSGDELVYTITYRNTGADVLTNLVVSDATPAYTRFVSAADGTRPAGLTAPTIAAPSVGGKGAVSWTFGGGLNPGQSGTVTFRVRVD